MFEGMIQVPNCKDLRLQIQVPIRFNVSWRGILISEEFPAPETRDSLKGDTENLPSQ